MELRSGRVLDPMSVKHKISRKVITNLEKMLDDLKLEEKKTKLEDGTIMKEAKTFIDFLFYHCVKYVANEVVLEEIKRGQGRKPNLYQLINWKENENFWKQTFRKALLDLRCKLSLYTLSRAFDFFIRFEHPAQLERPEELTRMESKLKSHIGDLYYHDADSTIMVELMHQQDQVKTRAFPIPDKKVYLNQLADDLASQIINPIFNDYNPNKVPWTKIFKYSKERSCYIPEVDGGCTVVRLPYTYFSMPTSYEYKILETGERFTSIETNARKAVLLHKRCTEKE